MKTQKFEISANIDFTSLEKEMADRIRSETRRQLNDQITLAFHKGRKETAYGEAIPTGHLHKLIEGMTAEKMNDPKNLDKIQAIIDREWDAALEEATKRAIQHRANNIAFNTVKQKLKTIE